MFGYMQSEECGEAAACSPRSGSGGEVNSGGGPPDPSPPKLPNLAQAGSFELTAIETLEEREMPTFLMLTNLTAEGVRTLKNHPGRIAEVNREVEQMGVKVVSQYATLGQYDFVTVVEAPDEQTMAKVSVELGSRGTMTSQTLAALPAEDLASSL